MSLRRLPAIALAGLLLAVAVATAVVLALRPAEAAPIPVPVPVYEIESVSGAHVASLLNLPLGQPGVPQVPMPVDIDGDLLPDVTVGLNLLDVEGGLPLPISITDTVAPNVQIDRLITAPILGQPSKPLRINIKLTLVDITGEQGPTVVRFGYDTGLGGSIPTSYKAVLGGLDSFFNPLTATVDTTAGYLGIDPGLGDLGLTSVAGAYRGPLHVIAGVDTDAIDAAIDAGFDPMPQRLEVGYGSDDLQHVTLAHATDADVDLDAAIDLVTAGEGDEADTTTTVDATIERLPREVAIDIGTGDAGAGEVHYATSSDGRLPDATLDLARHQDGERPLNADVAVDGLPPTLDVVWSVPDDGPVHADLDAGGDGIGAVEATIATYDESPHIVAHVPTEEQYVALQTGPDGMAGDVLVQARLERVRSATVDQAVDGRLVAELDAGDGAAPLAAYVDADLRSMPEPGPDLLIDALVAPLPRQLHLDLATDATPGAAAPLTLAYDASRSTDIAATIEVLDPDAGAGAACGDPGTVCGSVGVLNLARSLDAAVARPAAGVTTVAVDAVPTGDDDPDDPDDDPDPSAPRPDLAVDLVLGAPLDDTEGPALPTYLDGQLLGVPTSTRARLVTDELGAIERVDVAACAIDFAADDPACSEATVDGEVGLVDLIARNFDEAARPADLPPPAASAVGVPRHVSAVLRGLEDLDVDGMRYEVAARIDRIHRVSLLTVEDRTGAHVDLGDGEDDLAIHLDADGLDDPDPDAPDDARIDVDADVLVSPLPETIDLCLGANGRAVAGPTHDLTAACESEDPFGDDEAPEVAPMELAFAAADGFDLTGGFALARHLGPGVADDEGTVARFDLDEVPSQLTAAIALPAGPDDLTPTRVRTHAPGATATNGSLAFEQTTGGATCAEAAPEAGTMLCADVDIDGLPEHASVLADLGDPGAEGGSGDDETTERHIAFHACDYDFAAEAEAFEELEQIDDACRPDTETSIGSLAARVRVDRGDAGPVPILEVPGGNHAALALDVGAAGTDDIALDADVAVEEVRHLTMRQDGGRTAAYADLGDGDDPFAVAVDADGRDGEVEDPDEVDDLRFVVDATIDPLPEQLGFTFEGPTEAQDDEPTRIRLQSADPTLVTGAAQLFEEHSAEDVCGETGSLCAELTVERLPEDTDIVLAQTLGVLGPITRSTTEVDVTADPHDGQAAPDLALAATVGPHSFGLDRDLPLVADVDLDGFPRRTSVRMQDTTGPLGPHLDSLDVHTCEWDVDAEACDGPEGQLDAIEASVRTFLLRPAGFPPPEPVEGGHYASIAMDGELFEAAARVTDIREVRLLNQPDGVGSQWGNIVGARVRAGNGEPLVVSAHLNDVSVGPRSFLDRSYDDALLDADGTVTISNLPDDITVCMREAGIVNGDGTDSLLTARCEVDDPFAGDDDPSSEPMSFAYLASDTIDSVEADAHLSISDADDSPLPLHVSGMVDLIQVPAEVEVHVATPEPDSEGEALLVHVDAPLGQPPTEIVADVELLVDDAVCADPRDATTAICAEATFTNLPRTVDVRFAPDADGENLAVHATGGDDAFDVTGIDFSMVRPWDDDEDDPDDIRPAMVVRGELLGLPLSVTGFVRSPGDGGGAPDFEIAAEPSLGEATIEFQNFVAPDVLPTAPPSQRLDGEQPPAPLPTPEQYVNLFQIGRQVRATAHLRQVEGAGFRQQRDADGNGLDTIVASADFSTSQDLRAYADLRPPVGDGALAGNRLIADVTLTDLPEEIDVCFRGSQATGVSPAEGTATWCDGRSGGGIEVRGTNTGPEDGIDVNAFLRLTGPDGRHIAGVVDVEDIPAVVRAEFPVGDTGLTDGVLDVATFDAELVPTPIDRIAARVASFDLPSVYADPVYDERVRGDEPFAFLDEVPAGQHLHAGILDGAYAVSASIGSRDDEAPAARFEHLRMAPEACAAPDTDPDADGVQAPGDYPRFPADEVSSYRCVQLELDDDLPADGDPLDVQLVHQDGSRRIALTDAGIDDVPNWLQLTMTRTVLYEDTDDTPQHEQALRRWCGRAVDEPEDADCVAPLVRIDQASPATLHGDLRFLDDIEDADHLDGLVPVEAGFLPDLTASPGQDGEGWTDWDDPRGIRVRVARFDPALEDDDEETDEGDLGPARVAADARLRLTLPGSITVDQLQSWGGDTRTITNEIASEGSDFRFRIAFRDPAGDAVEALGRVAALLQQADGTFIELAGPGSVEDADPAGGFPLPGELGIGFYRRMQNFTANHDTYYPHPMRSSFSQVEGRVSTPVHIGLRMLTPDADSAALGQLAVRADVLNVPPFEPGDVSADPSFRLILETVGERPGDENGAGEGGDDGCTAVKCTDIDVGVDASVLIDFQPDNEQPPARRVEVFVRKGVPKVPVTNNGKTIAKGKNAVELWAFQEIGGDDNPPALISGRARVVLDPLSVYWHRGVYLLGSLTFDMSGDVTIDFEMEHVNHLRVRENLVRLVIDSEGADGGRTALHPTMYLDHLSFELFGLLLPLANIYWTSGDTQVDHRFMGCDGQGIENGVSVDNNGPEGDWALWPVNEHQFATFGLAHLHTIIGPFFCLAKVSELVSEHPLPDWTVPGHDVPDAPVGVTDPGLAEEDDEPQAPTHTVEGELALCGAHAFDALTVADGGTITVAHSADDTVSVPGGTPDCPPGDVGQLTLVADDLTVADGGTIRARGPNVGGPDGRPGGTLEIHARDLTVANGGTIDLAGEGGDATPGVDCSDVGDTPGAGGAGGSLLLASRHGVNDGTITVAGGRGGRSTDGGGDGGNGGSATVDIADWNGNDVIVAGGLGGADDCGGDAGADGDDGPTPTYDGAWSAPVPPGGYWHSPGFDAEDGIPIPFETTVGDPGVGYQVVLCYRDTTGQAVVDAGGASPEQLLAAEMPSSADVSASDPCGGHPVYASAIRTAAEIVHDPDNPELFEYEPGYPVPEDGFIGFWTTVIRLPEADHDCVADPVAGCELLETRVPTTPRLVLGIDRTDPELTVTGPEEPFGTLATTIPLTFEASDPTFPLGSGIARIRCRNEGGAWAPCASGVPWKLSPGAGAKIVEVQVTDVAGNVENYLLDGFADPALPPDVSMALVPDAGPSGWYTEVPDIELQIDEAIGDPGDPPFFWTMDEAREQSCGAAGESTCTVEGSTFDHLGSGEHRFGFTGHDDHGLRWSQGFYLDEDNAVLGLSTTFLLDAHDPLLSVFVVPPEPNGDDGWHTRSPYLVAAAIDDIGGSGLAAIEYSIDGDPWLAYDGPVELPDGSHASACVRATDVAGRTTERCAADVPLQVDHVEPGALAVPTPADGAAGWHVTAPSVTFGVFDTGSGPSTDHGSIRYRIDNGPYVECDAPCPIDDGQLATTGHHEVQWSALDEAGNRHEEDTVAVDVDTDAPVTRLARAFFRPEGDGWHLREPQVRLFADDQAGGSGVASTWIAIDGDPGVEYDGPVTIDDGEHDVCAWSVDGAGNQAEPTCWSISVDTADPVTTLLEPLPDGEGGWHLDATTVSANGADPLPGSGVDTVLVSVDGRPFVAPGGPVDLGEGMHHVRAFSIDEAGRHSEVVASTVTVDRSDPISRARVFGPSPAANGWWRSEPVVHLTATDGAENAGIERIEYRLDANGWEDYDGPITVPAGVHSVTHRAVDLAGRVGPSSVVDLAVDLAPPVIRATSPNPGIWLKLLGLLGPANAQLRWQVTEDHADSVRIVVLIHDLTGNVVRQLDGGVHAVTPGVPLNGHTLWDGTDQTLLGVVPLGIYYYRVVAVDEAGNWAHSGESAPLQIKLKLF